MREMLDFISSYSLVDLIPMETAVYLRLFERANENLWPLPLLTVLSGIALTLVVTFKRHINATPWRWVTWGVLGAAWLLVGYQFHWRLLAELNWTGDYFGLLFIAQGFLLLLLLFLGKPTPAANNRLFEKLLGVIMMVCAAVVYPLIPWITDRSWSSSELFAIAPDPTCLLTLGVLLATHSARWWLLIIPLLWCPISGAMAYAMDLPSGLLLLAAGALPLLVVARK
jgi:hypothetical protein